MFFIELNNIYLVRFISFENASKIHQNVRSTTELCINVIDIVAGRPSALPPLGHALRGRSDPGGGLGDGQDAQEKYVAS